MAGWCRSSKEKKRREHLETKYRHLRGCVTGAQRQAEQTEPGDLATHSEEAAPDLTGGKNH